MTTAERMKQRRKELGLSAEHVASKLNCSPATVYRYEKGDIEKMPIDILTPLSKILCTTPAYLMGWDDNPVEMPTLPADAIEVARAYDALPSLDAKNMIRGSLGLSRLTESKSKTG